MGRGFWGSRGRDRVARQTASPRRRHSDRGVPHVYVPSYYWHVQSCRADRHHRHVHVDLKINGEALVLNSLTHAWGEHKRLAIDFEVNVDVPVVPVGSAGLYV